MAVFTVTPSEDKKDNQNREEIHPSVPALLLLQ